MERLEGNIWKSYAFQVFADSVSLVVPIIVLFWQANGLSLTQIMILQSLFSITIVALEVPTGYFADIHGRKKSLIIGSISLTLGIAVYSLGNDFFTFFLGETFMAIGVSFISGADSALLYDSLKELRREQEYKRLWGNASFYAILGMVIGNVIGGFIGKIDLRYPFYIAIPFVALLIPLACSLHEPKRHKRIFEKGYLHELHRVLRDDIWGSIRLRWLIIYAATIFTAYQAALWLYQPYMKLTGLDIAYFGIVFALFNIVAAISAKYADSVEHKLGLGKSLSLLFIVVAIGYLLMGTAVFVFSFVFILLHQFVRGFYKIVISDAIHNLTGSEYRATVISAQSMIARLSYAILIPFIGYVADVYSLTQALFLMGIISLVTGTILMIILKKNEVI